MTQAARTRHRRADRDAEADRGIRPFWARWNSTVERRYTVGVEEELMLLQRSDHSLAQSSDEILARLSGDLRACTSPETHASVIELATGIHLDVAGAATELAGLRARLARELSVIGLTAASAGTYPLAGADEVKVSGAARSERLPARCGCSRADRRRWRCTCTLGSRSPRMRSGCSTPFAR